MQNKTILISIISIALAVIIGLLLWVILRNQGGNRGGSSLQAFLEKTLQENQQLKDTAAQAERKINTLDSLLREKEREIQVLGNTQALKQALANAQAAVSQLNAVIEQIKQEKAILEEKNITVNSRFQNITRELTAALEDLKLTKQELAELKKKSIQAAAIVIPEAKLSQGVTENEKQIKALQSELTKLNTAKLSLQEQLNKKDKYLQELSLLNQNFKAQINQLSPVSQESQAEAAKQNKELARLKDELSGSQLKLSGLQEELAERENELLKLKSQLAKAKAPSSYSNEGSFRQQWEEAKRLYENARSQIGQLSEILTAKELELNNQRKESIVLKNEASGLKEKLAGLDNALKSAQSDIQKVKALESEKLNLQAQYSQAQEDLRKQNELIASLSNALDMLNKKIAQREEEKKNLEMTLVKESSNKTTLEEELDKQRRRVDELNNFYSGLKSQIVQFSNLLTDKESELNQNQKEMSALKNELLFQQSRVGNLEKDLGETKERQKKISENLSQAATLNTALQESLSGVTQSLSPEKEEAQYRKKAEELKRKVEVILSPESSP